MTDLGAGTRHLGTQVDQVERPQGAGFRRCFPGSTASPASAALAVQVATQPLGESPGAVGVDALVDRLGRDRVATDAPGASQFNTVI